HRRDREDHHRQRQSEVELHEAHPVVEALARGADHGDGAELRRHHRKADGPPGIAPVAEEVPLDLTAAACVLDAGVDDPGQVEPDDEPVDGMHGYPANETWSSQSRTSVRAWTPRTFNAERQKRGGSCGPSVTAPSPPRAAARRLPAVPGGGRPPSGCRGRGAPARRQPPGPFAWAPGLPPSHAPRRSAGG